MIFYLNSIFLMLRLLLAMLNDETLVFDNKMNLQLFLYAWGNCIKIILIMGNVKMHSY